MTEDTGFVADDAPAVVDWERIQRLRQATATERPLPPLPQYQCGNCGEEFGSNCDPGDIRCPECEASMCPHCKRWFGGDWDGEREDSSPGTLQERIDGLSKALAAATEIIAERDARLAALDACLPAGADRPVTPELLTALGALYDVFWNQVGTLEGDRPGYSLISYEDVNALDEAASAVEALLFPATTDEEEAARAAQAVTELSAALSVDTTSDTGETGPGNGAEGREGAAQ